MLMGRLVLLLLSLGHPRHLCSHLAVSEFMPVSSSGADFEKVPMFLGVGIMKS